MPSFLPDTVPNLKDSLDDTSSLKERAFRAILDAVTSREMRPGFLYTESEIAEKLSISRTPVREALQQLQSKGLIEFVHRKGFSIRTMNEKEIQDLYSCRIIMETGMLRVLSEQLTPYQIRHLEKAHQSLSATMLKQNIKDAVKADREFHRFMASLTGNDYLLMYLENIRDLIDLAGTYVPERAMRMTDVVTEHEKIVKMLKNRDAAGAVTAMEIHLDNTKKLVIKSVAYRLG